MFDAEVYCQRRRILVDRMSEGGIALFLGNFDCPMNYPDNIYEFRQDSCFRYYFGLNETGLAGAIDLDSGESILFGTELSVEDIVWVGYRPSLKEKGDRISVAAVQPYDDLETYLKKSSKQGRPIYVPPAYRADIRVRLMGWQDQGVIIADSMELVDTIILQRSIKSDEEVAEIEKAITVSHEIQTTVMATARSGMRECELKGLVDAIQTKHGCKNAFPTILTIHGEILHNNDYDNELCQGHLVVNDSGVESPFGYCSDITRTFPVAGRFDSRQKDIYEIVLTAQQAAISAIKPGALFRDIHLLACRVLTEGLNALGLMRGDIDGAVAAGAHALFFPCGLGHLLGMDVHDMEGLGEDRVGYNSQIKRSNQFGLRSLRLARPIQAGFVVTVEPGIYFIPPLLEQWEQQKHCSNFINYEKVKAFMGFGGIRIEDDILVTSNGYRELGPVAPRTIEQVECACHS